MADVELVQPDAWKIPCPICGEMVLGQLAPYFGHMISNHDNGVLSFVQKMATCGSSVENATGVRRGPKDGSNAIRKYPENYCPLDGDNFDTQAELVTHLLDEHDFA